MPMGGNDDVYECGAVHLPDHPLSHGAGYTGATQVHHLVRLTVLGLNVLWDRRGRPKGQRRHGRGGAGSRALPSLSSSGWAIGEC